MANVNGIDGGSPFDDYANLANQAPFASGYQPTSRTAADVIRRVQRQFGDESEMQLETVDIVGWINDGQRDIAERERILKGKATQPTIPGQRDYRWPSVGILSVDSLHVGGAPLNNVPFAQVEQDYLNTDVDSTGKPTLWYEWAGQFSFFPVPDSTYTIEIFFSQVPAQVSITTDVLGIPDKYFNSLVHYVLMQAYEMDEDWQAAQAKQQAYQDSLTSIGDDERDAANMTYPTITRAVDW
jgi:hypothetical protein